MQVDARGLIVADDSSMIRDLLRSHLDPRFGHVYLATDGAEAVEIARRILARLVLLDYRMPRLNGLDACRAIRGLEAYARVPVVLLTAYDDERARREAMRVGVSSFVPKPFSPEQLIEAVGVLISADGDPEDGLAQCRDRLHLQRVIDSATRQRHRIGLAERQLLPGDLWRH
jgi:CheY-like chemotaxis protein